MAWNWKPDPPACDTLFMWNVPHGTTEDILADFLQSSFGGIVLWKKIFNKKVGGGLSALVQLDSIEKATEIKEALHDTIPEGQTLPVGVTYKEDSKKDGGGSGGGWSEKAETIDTDNLYMQNLPPGVDKDILDVYFSEFGPIVQCRILDGGTAGLVRFESPQVAQAVMSNMNGKTLPGASSPLIVRPATKKPSYGKDQSKGESKGTLVESRSSPYAPSEGSKGKTGPPPRDPGVTAVGLLEALVSQNFIPDGTKAENDCFVLYVCGLPVDADEGLLYKMFAPFGSVLSVCMQRKTAAAGYEYVIAFVNFGVQESAEHAIGMYNQMRLPDGTYLKVAHKPSKGVPSRDVEAEYVAENFPELTQSFPVVAENFPGVVENFPNAAGNFPGAAGNFPGAAGNFHAAAGNFPGVGADPAGPLTVPTNMVNTQQPECDCIRFSPKGLVPYDSDYLGSGRQRYQDVRSGQFWVEQADGSIRITANGYIDPIPCKCKKPKPQAMEWQQPLSAPPAADPLAEARQFLHSQNEELQDEVEKLRKQMSSFQQMGEEEQAWSSDEQSRWSGKRSSRSQSQFQNEALREGLEKLRRIQQAKYDRF